jgi:sigma-E factor negative regulatory protein RseA
MTLGDLDDKAKAALSALADGEADVAGSAAACAAWARDDRLRADWHAWHLIGDVLRSDDLAADPRGDRRLCEAIRIRLQSEAVVLAPADVDSAEATPRAATADGSWRVGSRSGRGRWAAGGAVAAGLILVAGTFALLRPDDLAAPALLASGDAAPARVASRDAVPAPLSPTAEPSTTPAMAGARSPGAETATPPALVADGKWIRDSRLDRYLEAHKQFAGTSALGVPSAFLRSATLDTAAR